MSRDSDAPFPTAAELATQALERMAAGTPVAEVVNPDLVSADLLVRRRAAALYLSEHTQAVLATMADICKRGGRNYQAALKTFAHLAWGVGDVAEPDDEYARKASDLYERVRELDQKGVLQVACAFIQGYLEKHPSETQAVLRMLGMKGAE